MHHISQEICISKYVCLRVGQDVFSLPLRHGHFALGKTVNFLVSINMATPALDFLSLSSPSPSFLHFTLISFFFIPNVVFSDFLGID